MRPRRAADHSSPSSAAVMEEYSYTSSHPLGQTLHIYTHTVYVCSLLYLANVVYHFPLLLRRVSDEWSMLIRMMSRQKVITIFLR